MQHANNRRLVILAPVFEAADGGGRSKKLRRPEQGHAAATSGLHSLRGSCFSNASPSIAASESRVMSPALVLYGRAEPLHPYGVAMSPAARGRREELLLEQTRMLAQ